MWALVRSPDLLGSLRRRRGLLRGGSSLVSGCLKTARQANVSRYEVRLKFSGRSINLMMRENILCGLYSEKKTKPCHCDK